MATVQAWGWFSVVVQIAISVFRLKAFDSLERLQVSQALAARQSNKEKGRL
jgi:hypothetical protein